MMRAKSSTISDLVRDGHASPRDGALLIELRRRMGESARSPRMGVAGVVAALAAIIITLITGQRPNNSA